MEEGIDLNIACWMEWICIVDEWKWVNREMNWYSERLMTLSSWLESHINTSVGVVLLQFLRRRRHLAPTNESGHVCSPIIL